VDNGLTWIPDEWRIITIRLAVPPVPIALRAILRMLGIGLPLIVVGGVLAASEASKRQQAR